MQYPIDIFKDCSKLCQICQRQGLLFQFSKKDTNNSVIISFRGSKTLLDWKYNLDSKSYNDGSYILHKGFYKKFNKIKPEINNFIEDCEDNSIIFTGYSSGGVMACLSAFEYKDKTKACITFATPNFCNKSFSNDFDKNIKETYRLIYGNDPISFSPNIYSNVGNIYHIINKNEVNYDEYYDIKNYNIKDHDILNYVDYFNHLTNDEYCN